MSIYYIDSELSHHGVKGMKWGVRKEQKYLAKSAKYGNKESKARTRLMKNYYGSKRIYNKHMASMQKDYNNAKSLKEKLRVGYGGAENNARNARANAEINRMYASRAKKTKTKLKYQRTASNLDNMEAHWNRVSAHSPSTVKRVKYSMKHIGKVPLTNVRSGKQTTYGREMAKVIAVSTAYSVASAAAQSYFENKY